MSKTDPEIFLHHNDLPEDVLDTFGESIAIDTETMGLNLIRDRLCVVQLSAGDHTAHLVKFDGSDFSAPNLRALLEDENKLKIFHFARFDIAAIQYYLEVTCKPVFCTKIASRMVRTFTEKHGLKSLCSELLGVELSKQQQSSDWGAPEITEEQMLYAANDVLYLHALKDKMIDALVRESRLHLAEECFKFLPTRAELDLIGWPEVDIFAHA